MIAPDATDQAVMAERAAFLAQLRPFHVRLSALLVPIDAKSDDEEVIDAAALRLEVTRLSTLIESIEQGLHRSDPEQGANLS